MESVGLAEQVEHVENVEVELLEGRICLVEESWQVVLLLEMVAAGRVAFYCQHFQVVPTLFHAKISSLGNLLAVIQKPCLHLVVLQLPLHKPQRE